MRTSVRGMKLGMREIPARTDPPKVWSTGKTRVGEERAKKEEKEDWQGRNLCAIYHALDVVLAFALQRAVVSVGQLLSVTILQYGCRFQL